MYYPCSKNKGADQLRGYREADLRLCFRMCKKPVFSIRIVILCYVNSSLNMLNLSNLRQMTFLHFPIRNLKGPRCRFIGQGQPMEEDSALNNFRCLGYEPRY